MTREDLPFADAVRAEAGWNQTLADWNRFLIHQPEGCFIAEASTQTVARHSNAETPPPESIPIVAPHSNAESPPPESIPIAAPHSNAEPPPPKSTQTAAPHSNAESPPPESIPIVAPHSNAEPRSPTTSSSEVHPLGSPTNRSEMRAVGTATTWVHGQHLAWIGMVLVLSEARGQGTGTALLQHCIRFLQGRGVRGIRLDATPLGRPVYERLGFKAEWELHRWEHPNWPGLMRPESSDHTENHRIRPWRKSDTQPESPVLALERLALGTPRTRLLEALSTTSLQSIVLSDDTDNVSAFGMIRAGSRATYLGPAVAQDPASAEGILEALLSQPMRTPLFWDIPEPNWPARAWAEAHGFRRQRVLTRMYLGNPEPAGDPQLQLALSGPETG